MYHLKTRSGVDWHYDTQGEGEPVLFLHGWGGSLGLWADQFEYFVKNFKVISVDLPGHGQTSWLPLDMHGFAGDLKELTERLTGDKINFVASSLGGLLALKFYSLFPHSVKRISFIGSLPKFSQDENFPFGLEAEKIKKLAGQLKTDYPAIVHIFFRSLFTQREREGARFQWLEQFHSPEHLPKQEALDDFLNILKHEDMRDVLKKLKIPVQLVNGSEDYICSMDSLNYLKAELPSARVALFKGCGHFPFISQPGEFNKVLEEFLKEDPEECEFPKETIYDFTRSS